jgi:CubicO group peptidase (beta-lactamase class C family)
MKKIIISLSLVIICVACIFSQSIDTIPALDSLNIFLKENIKDTDPGAAILIKQDGETVYENYRGMANRQKGEKLTSKTTMGIASMSKQFEGMAVLILVNQGKLSLDDYINTYLKDLPIDNRKITIKQLLTHVSGLPEITQNEKFMNSLDKPRSVDEILSIALKDTMRHEVGEKYMYCNTGYTIIVKLIEQITGQSYHDFLAENILNPLGMKNTYSCDKNHNALDIASRYKQDSTGFHDAVKVHFSNLIGGGGIISNVRDMGIWADALLSGIGLPKNYKEMWNTTILNNGNDTQYGLGMGTSKADGDLFYYHPGQGSGMNAINLIFPESNISITVIRNVSKPKTSSAEIALYAYSQLKKYYLSANKSAIK